MVVDYHHKHLVRNLSSPVHGDLHRVAHSKPNYVDFANCNQSVSLQMWQLEQYKGNQHKRQSTVQERHRIPKCSFVFKSGHTVRISDELVVLLNA